MTDTSDFFERLIYEQEAMELRREGESKLGRLVSYLLRLGRTDDALSVSEDEGARNRFFAEFGIA